MSLRIGRFSVLSKIGEGGMGAVYSAFDEELDRRVAIKLVRKNLAGETKGDARMQREAQAMARLSHPNVVQVYDVGTHEGQIFIAMEFVRGSTLRDWQESLDPSSPTARRQIVEMYIQAGRGLAAAHERDLVHRDFKPDNVLVGDDGRARVLDFGLAASARTRGGGGGDCGDGSDGSDGGAPLMPTSEVMRSDLTRTGSLMGTPAFMAPEQFLAQPSDPRTDQFSFCVALYAALYGAPPFEGNTLAARQASVCSGEVQPAPADSRVPAWLRRILLRGLEARPEDRYGGMEELLRALADDPELARARRLRLSGIVVGALALGALLIALARVGWDAWQHLEIEAEAYENLEIMESRVAELEAANDEAEAERTFASFVRKPAYHGTEAPALAWLHRAEREAAAGRNRAAIDAYAASYAIATSREHEVAALIALIRFSRERERWDGFVEAVTTLEQSAPEAFVGPELGSARLSSAFIRRDFAEASALLSGTSPRDEHLRRLIRALAPANKTSVRGVLIDRVSPAGDGEYALPTPGKRLVRVAADLDLTPIATHETTLDHFQGLAVGASPHYIAHDPASGEDVVLRADGGRLTELFRWSDSPAAAVLSDDIDGDGRPEFYVGTGPYSRHMLELVRGPEEGWSTREVSPTVDARRSDVNSIAAADLDGDGVTELVVSVGPWRAYELQILRLDPATERFQRVTRKKLGNVDAALVRRGPGPPEIAVWKNDEFTTPLMFPPDQPRGVASGLHLFRLVNGHLEETADYPTPEGATVGYSRVMVGDLDGDGRDEIVVHDSRDEASGEVVHTTLIFSDDPEDPGGRVLRLPLAHTWPVDVRDLDGDGDAELLVRLDDEQIWAVGAGTNHLPLLAGASPGPELDPSEVPEDFARVWGRAADLAEMGLDTQAAEAYADLAIATVDPTLAAQALLRSAQISEEQGRDRLAAQRFARAADSATVSGEAGQAALRAYRRRGDMDAARALLDHLLTEVPGLRPESARALKEARAELGDRDRGVELTFAAALDPSWQLHSPHSLYRDAARTLLRLDMVGGGLVAALPVKVEDGVLSLEIDLDLLRVEWGESLEIGLAAGDETAQLGFGVAIRGDGGVGDEWTNVSCNTFGVVTNVNISAGTAYPREPGHHVVRVVLDRARGETSCTVSGPDGQELLYRRVPTIEGEPIATETELRIRGRSINSTGWIAAELGRLALVGATLRRDEEPLPLATARQALVEGNLSEALALIDEQALTDLGDQPVDVSTWRLLALTRLGRWAEAEDVLRPLLVGAEAANLPPPALMPLFRTMPAAARGLLSAIGSLGLYRRWLLDTMGYLVGLGHSDPFALQVLRVALDDLDPEDSLPPEELSRLFALRGSVYARLSMHARARRDYGAAIAISRRAELGADPEVVGLIQRRQVGWSLREAVMAITAGDPEGGRDIVVDLLDEPVDEAFIVDSLKAWPEFAPLVEELGIR